MPLRKGIELIIGTMFCGKTEELLRRLRRIEIPNNTVQLFKPTIDTRYSKDDVCAHSGSSRPGFLVKNTAELIKKYNEKTDVIGIDELQFFDDKIIDFILDKQEKHLFILSGLPFNFRAEPFEFKDSKKQLIELIPYTRITYLQSHYLISNNLIPFIF